MGSFATFLPSIFAQGRSKDVAVCRCGNTYVNPLMQHTTLSAILLSHTLRRSVSHDTNSTFLRHMRPEVSTYSYTDVESKFPLRVLSKRQGPPVITYLQLATAKGQ